MSRFKRLSRNELIDSVISLLQKVALILGIVLLVIASMIENEIIKTICNCIGSSLVSISLVTILFDRWKEQKDNTMDVVKAQFEELNSLQRSYVQSVRNQLDELGNSQKPYMELVKEMHERQKKEKKEKFFLMGPASYRGSGQELEEIANIDKNSGKILLIGSMSEGKIKEEYAFTTLLNGDNFRLLRKDKAVLSYGTAFPYLNESKKSEYYNAFKGAIEEGLGLNVSIIYPEKVVADIKNIEDTIGVSKDTIRDFKNMISMFIKEGTILKSHIELRLSRYFSPCSFSSFEFDSGRTIRTLEFNFMHEGENGVKLSQVHDNPPTSKDNVHGKFSEFLFNRYNRLYKESIVALRYPMQDITYYVLGIIVDVPNDSNKQSKFAVVNGSELFKIVVHLDVSDGALKLLVKTNEDKYQDYEKEIEERRISELCNTVIGNVLIGYEKQTGCILVPNRSFEIDPDTFLLLGSVVKTQKDFGLFNTIDFLEEESQIYNKISSICHDSSIVNKIKSIINMS